MTGVVKLISEPEEVEPRKIPPEDWRRYESYVGEIFTALGMNLASPGTRETPRRFLQALRDATGRPVVVLDSSGIVAGAQAARFVLMTDTVGEALLRRVDGDEGWALSTAEV